MQFAGVHTLLQPRSVPVWWRAREVHTRLPLRLTPTGSPRHESRALKSLAAAAHVVGTNVTRRQSLQTIVLGLRLAVAAHAAQRPNSQVTPLLSKHSPRKFPTVLVRRGERTRQIAGVKVLLGTGQQRHFFCKPI